MSDNVWLESPIYHEYVRLGKVHEEKYLAIKWYRGLTIKDYRFVGYDKNMTHTGTNRFRVVPSSKGGFTNHVTAQYLGEAYVRFQTTTFKIITGYSGANRLFLVAHYPEGVEEIVGFVPSSRLVGKINAIFRKFFISPQNCHEYVFRIFRDQETGFYDIDIYFRDTNLKPIGEGEVIKDMVPLIRSHWSGWDSPRAMSVVELLKKTVIPLELHKPGRNEYYAWFKEYGGFTSEQCERAYLYRAEVRLP